MAGPSALPTRDTGPVHGDLVLSRLAQAAVEIEDQATDAEPDTVGLRIGDDSTGVLFLGDLRTLQRLIAEADRQLTRLHRHRRAPGR